MLASTSRYPYSSHRSPATPPLISPDYQYRSSYESQSRQQENSQVRSVAGSSKDLPAYTGHNTFPSLSSEYSYNAPSSSRMPYTPTLPSPATLLRPSFVEQDDHLTLQPIIIQPDSVSPSLPLTWEFDFQPKSHILPPIPMADEIIAPMVPQTKLKMDMNMATTGSVAATPGIQTPLASYAAQMVVWLWFRNQQPPSLPSPTSTTSPSLNSDPFSSNSSLNPLQVQPSASFVNFVGRLLQITMVSHSVTLLALLYIHRLREKRNVIGQAGSEQRPFVASLMLSNKYLDDNTYTNKTWAELSGMSLTEINTEFLIGMNWELGVKLEEYQHWRKLLDGFIYAREREASMSRRPTWTPNLDFLQTFPTPPLSLPSSDPASHPLVARARSASPQNSTSVNGHHHHFSLDCSPSEHRKRSAGDAFNGEMPSSATVYEGLRLPSRKAGFVDANNLSLAQRDLPSAAPAPHYPLPNPNKPLQSTASTLGRTSSLNRRIARLPEHGRRGSLGHPHFEASEHGSLVPTPILPPGVHGWSENGIVPEEYGALVLPYQGVAQPQLVPPEHLMFYTLAAAPHPGPDGAPRKAILHYQDPSGAIAYSHYPPQPVQAFVTHPHSLVTTPILPMHNLMIQPPQPSPLRPGADVHPSHIPVSSVSTPLNGFPPSHGVYNAYGSSAHGHIGFGQPAQPQPAQFANAGPPGYTYNPHEQPSYTVGYGFVPHTQRSSHDGYFAAPVQATPVSTLPSAGPNGWTGPGHMSRWSVGSDEYTYQSHTGSGGRGSMDAGPSRGQQMLTQIGNPGFGPRGKAYTTRSEWSSPLPGYSYGPGWQQGHPRHQ